MKALREADEMQAPIYTIDAPSYPSHADLVYFIGRQLGKAEGLTEGIQSTYRLRHRGKITRGEAQAEKAKVTGRLEFLYKQTKNVEREISGDGDAVPDPRASHQIADLIVKVWALGGGEGRA